MSEARIIEKTVSHPSGHSATFYLIETVHLGGTKTHRDSDRSFSSENEARKAAEHDSHEVDPILYTEG